MTDPLDKPRPHPGPFFITIAMYWVFGTVLGSWGARAFGSGANWIGFLFVVILAFCVATWRATRPLWQRILLIPGGLVFVAVAGAPMARWVMTVTGAWYPDPMIDRGVLVAATSPVVAWALLQSRAYSREGDESGRQTHQR
jgi:hypothetical protein